MNVARRLRSLLRRSWVTPVLMGLLCFVIYNANFRQIGAGDSLPARYLPLILWKYGTFDLEANSRLIAHGHPMFPERNRPAGYAGKVHYLEPTVHWMARTPPASTRFPISRRDAPARDAALPAGRDLA